MQTQNIIGLLILLIFLYPRVLRAFRRKRRIINIARLEKKRGTKVISLVHSDSGSPILDMLFGRFISTVDSQEIIKTLRKIPDDKPVDILLHTPGGMVLAAHQIAEALLKHKGEVNIHIPYYAMSGGTYLALAATNIYMPKTANLGPINPQIGRFPAVSIKEVLEKKDPKDIDDQTLILGDVSEKAISEVRENARSILTKNDYSKEQSDEILEELMSENYTHSRMIDYDLVKKIGLRVSEEVPEGFYKILDLYGIGRNSSVEHLDR